jgi:hypothetical protein
MHRTGHHPLASVLGPILLLLAMATTIVASPRRAEAYPIPPVTLWELVEKADTIVVATVEAERARERNSPREDWNDTVAVLSVSERWKGNPADRIEVPYPAGLVCPAPPRYEAGLPVLTFLTHDKKGRYETVGLSYGTLYPEPGDVAAFRNAVRQALIVQATKDPDQRGSARTEWLVSVAAAPATRWHGLYELASDGDALHAFYDDRVRKTTPLSAAQKETLATAFASTRVLDASLPMMLKLLSGHPSTAVDQTAVAAVDTLLDLARPPYWAAELTSAAIQRLGGAPGPVRAGKRRGDLTADPLLGGLEFDAKTLRRRWTALRKTLPYPKQTLDLPSNAGVPRVGAATPP